MMSIKVTDSGIIASPDPKPVISRTEQTYSEILNAAFKFMWSHPFREMTVEKLMRQTSVSRASFYNYFADPHELMESLLVILEADILAGTNSWFSDDSDPVALLHSGLAAEVHICHQCGPFMKAVTDAAATDARVETAWLGLLARFDNAVSDRIAADQELGLIESFDPWPVATALNQVSASMYIRTFGQRPRGLAEPVLDALSRLWISTLYGPQWVEGRTSTLHREQATQNPDQDGSNSRSSRAGAVHRRT